MKEKIQNVCEKLLTSIRKNAIILQTNKQTNKQTKVCLSKITRKEGNHWFNCSPNPWKRGCLWFNKRGGYYCSRW